MKAFTKTLPAYVLASMIGSVSMAVMAIEEASIGELILENESIEEANPENGQGMFNEDFSAVELGETLEFQIQGEENPNYSSTAEDAGSSEASFKITFRNQCHKPVYIALHYKSVPQGCLCITSPCPCDSNWTTDGWWYLDAGEDLRSQNTYLVKTPNRYWYYHAKSTDGSSVWSGSDVFSQIGAPYSPAGSFYGFRKNYYGSSIGGWHVVNLQCNG